MSRSVRSGPRKLTNKNNRVFRNPIKTIFNQTNQIEKYKILHDSVKLTYVHKRKSSRFTITEKEYKRESIKLRK